MRVLRGHEGMDQAQFCATCPVLARPNPLNQIVGLQKKEQEKPVWNLTVKLVIYDRSGTPKSDIMLQKPRRPEQKHSVSSLAGTRPATVCRRVSNWSAAKMPTSPIIQPPQ